MIPRRIAHLEKEIERINKRIPQFEKYHYGDILKLELKGFESEIRILKKELKLRSEDLNWWG